MVRLSLRQWGESLRPQEVLRLLLITIRFRPRRGVKMVEWGLTMTCVPLEWTVRYLLKCLLLERRSRSIVMEEGSLVKWDPKCRIARGARETLGITTRVDPLDPITREMVRKQILAPLELAIFRSRIGPPCLVVYTVATLLSVPRRRSPSPTGRAGMNRLLASGLWRMVLLPRETKFPVLRSWVMPRVLVLNVVRGVDRRPVDEKQLSTRVRWGVPWHRVLSLLRVGAPLRHITPCTPLVAPLR